MVCLQLGFAWHLRTHVVKATKGNATRSFFTERQFKEWEQTSESRGGWKIKFYKGISLFLGQVLHLLLVETRSSHKGTSAS